MSQPPLPDLTTQGVATILHAPSFPNCITASDWETQPFRKPLRAPWKVSVPTGSLPRLLNGFKPRDMDERWFVYADRPDSSGEFTVHFYRSWTGYKNFEVRGVVGGRVGDQHDMEGDGGKEIERDARFTEIIWETHEDVVRGQDEAAPAKMRARDICQYVLGVILEDEIE